MVLERERDHGRARARTLARASITQGDATGWFEELYREGANGQSIVPWAELRPNPNLTQAWDRLVGVQTPNRALVVGCGLGDDADWIAGRGIATTGFDISETAIATAQKRFHRPELEFVRADLFEPPGAWVGGFDLVFESYTLQALPAPVRPKALDRVASLVAPGGHLLLITRAREPNEPEGELPWPLTRSELGRFETHGLRPVSWEDYIDPMGGSRRFRIWYDRPGAPTGSGR
jgi:SAM-dependent methyltransferase